MAWGFIKEYQFYEDTQRMPALDAYLGLTE